MITDRLIKLIRMTLAGIILILLLPVLIIIAGIVAWDQKKSIFFIQKRIGIYGSIFEIIKFKTMQDRTVKSEFIESKDDALRVTTIGKIIRKIHFDELPQLINILKGEMAFVGPRPLMLEYMDHYSARQNKRHEVLPGITGLSQVKCTNRDTWEKRLEYDSIYVDKYLSSNSFHRILLDSKILLITLILPFRKILKKKSICNDTYLEFERFKGNDMGN